MTKTNQDIIDRIVELHKELDNITKTAKAVAEEKNIEYTDTFRRLASRIVNRDAEENQTDEDLDDIFLLAKSKEFDRSKKVFLISWVQSDTKVHPQMLKNMEAYAEKQDATIHLVAGRYKNPNSLEASSRIKSNEKDKYTWDKLSHPYIDSNRHKIHENLWVLSDVKVQPTASTPLSGLEGLTGIESCIVGHPRQQLKFLPTLDGCPDKIICTTGSLTLPNYTDTKVGMKSMFHHTLGFVVVELDDNDFIIRPVSCEEDGSFQDLIWYVSNGVVEEKTNSCEAIVWGDLHHGKHDGELLKASISQSLMMLNNNRKVVIHDAFDCNSVSHHDLRNPFSSLQKETENNDDLFKELYYLHSFFSSLNTFNYVVVRSNHDEHLDKWLCDTDWRKSTNKKAYLDISYIKSNNPDLSALECFFSQDKINNVVFLNENQSYKIKDIELSIHGHLGVSGSKGSPLQFKSLNTKAITGHTHSPLILDGLYTVGTMTPKRVDYNRGLNKWGWANVVVHHNGKRQLLIFNSNLNYSTLM